MIRQRPREARSAPRAPSDVESSLRDPPDDALAAIRSKLHQLSETKIADKEAQDELMTGLLAFLTDDNAGEIARALSPAELDSPFGLATLQRWLKVDPAGAARWIAQQPDATDDQAWAVAHQLVEDPRSLESYCDGLPGRAWTQTFLQRAGVEVVWRNPVEAIRLAQRMTPGRAQTDLLQTVAYAWTASDPGAALGWITQVPDPALHEQLVCAGAKAEAATDPLQAVEWLVFGVPSEPLMNDTLQSVIGTWVETKPAQVARLVERFSDGELRSATVGLVARRWLQLDLVAAAAWIKNLPEGERLSPTIAFTNPKPKEE